MSKGRVAFTTLTEADELFALPVGSVVMASTWVGGVFEKTASDEWTPWDSRDWAKTTEVLMWNFGSRAEYVVLEQARTDSRTERSN